VVLMGVSSHIYNKRHASLSRGSRQLASVASHGGHRVAISTVLEHREKQKWPGRVPRLPSTRRRTCGTDTSASSLRCRGCDDMAMWRCLPTGFASRAPDHPPSWDPHPIHREPLGSLLHDLGWLGQDVGGLVAVGDRHCDSCRRRYDRGRDGAAGDGLPHRVQCVLPLQFDGSFCFVCRPRFAIVTFGENANVFLKRGHSGKRAQRPVVVFVGENRGGTTESPFGLNPKKYPR
jgi:hypothetical protein